MRYVLAAPVLVLVLSAGCGGSDEDPYVAIPQPTQSTPSGLTVESGVAGIDVLAIADSGATDCERLGASHDLSVEAGDQIVLKNAEGDIVATAELEEPTTLPDAKVCVWSATFQNVPPGGRFYTAEITGAKSKSVAEAEVTKKRLVIEL